MLSTILIAMILSLEWTQSWWGMFFHSEAPMYTCSAGHAIQRGDNCLPCRIASTKAKTQKDNKAKLKKDEERRAIVIERSARTLTDINKIIAPYHCTCRSSLRFACQYCIDHPDVVD